MLSDPNMASFIQAYSDKWVSYIIHPRQKIKQNSLAYNYVLMAAFSQWFSLHPMPIAHSGLTGHVSPDHLWLSPNPSCWDHTYLEGEIQTGSLAVSPDLLFLDSVSTAHHFPQYLRAEAAVCFQALNRVCKVLTSLKGLHKCCTPWWCLVLSQFSWGSR